MESARARPGDSCSPRARCRSRLPHWQSPSARSRTHLPHWQPPRARCTTRLPRWQPPHARCTTRLPHWQPPRARRTTRLPHWQPPHARCTTRLPHWQPPCARCTTRWPASPDRPFTLETDPFTPPAPTDASPLRKHTTTGVQAVAIHQGVRTSRGCPRCLARGELRDRRQWTLFVRNPSQSRGPIGKEEQADAGRHYHRTNRGLRGETFQDRWRETRSEDRSLHHGATNPRASRGHRFFDHIDPRTIHTLPERSCKPK